MEPHSQGRAFMLKCVIMRRRDSLRKQMNNLTRGTKNGIKSQHLINP